MLLRPSPVAERGKVCALPPLPAYIKLPLGEPRNVTQCENPHKVGARRSGAQKAGLAYQRKVGAYLELVLGRAAVTSGPWFHYSSDASGRNYCQPDFLVADVLEVLVVEVKLRWTTDAWWQLRRLYLPVVAKAFPDRRVILLCITRSYDPAARIPEEVTFVDSPQEAVADAFNVMVWKP